MISIDKHAKRFRFHKRVMLLRCSYWKNNKCSRGSNRLKGKRQARRLDRWMVQNRSRLIRKFRITSNPSAKQHMSTTKALELILLQHRQRNHREHRYTNSSWVHHFSKILFQKIDELLGVRRLEHHLQNLLVLARKLECNQTYSKMARYWIIQI